MIEIKSYYKNTFFNIKNFLKNGFLYDEIDFTFSVGSKQLINGVFELLVIATVCIR